MKVNCWNPTSTWIHVRPVLCQVRSGNVILPRLSLPIAAALGHSCTPVVFWQHTCLSLSSHEPLESSHFHGFWTNCSPPSIASPCPLVEWAKRKCQEPSWVNRAGLRLNGENPGSHQSSSFPNIFHHAAQAFNTTQERDAWLWPPLKFSTEVSKGFI